MPFAALGVAALALSALALVAPLLSLAVAAALAPFLARLSPAGALLGLVLAARCFLPDPPALSLPPLRATLAAPLLALVPEPEASVAAGSLLGGRGTLPRELAAAFARTGTSHLLAVSGFNITLAATALGVALRPLGARGAAVGTVAVALAFALVAGGGAGVLRAALMSTIASVAILIGRPRTGLNALGAATVLLLLVAPRSVADLGFLLSVSATAGLLLFAGPLEKRLPGPRWLRTQLATTCAATLASLPVAAEAFGRISLVAPLANVLVAPLVAPLMLAAGAAMAFGALVAPLAVLPAGVAFALARGVRGVVEVLDALPFAAVSFPHAGLACLVAYASGFALVRLRRARPRGRALLAWSGAAGATAVLLVGALVGPPAPPARILALDVGQGDAFLLEAGGARVLVDGGPDPARTLRALGDALPPFARRIDVVALTHSHADHGTGLAAVIERYEVGLALEPAGLDANGVADLWHAALARGGVPVRAVRRGDVIRLSGLELEVLAPLGDPADTLANLVLRANAGSLRALLLGDATERGQQDVLLHPEDLRADVYVPPHHGAGTPHADALVRAARPRVALLSLGRGNRYGHPAPETLRALARLPALRTDRDGTLEVSLDGGSLVCRVHAAALPGVWGGLLARPAPCA